MNIEDLPKLPQRQDSLDAQLRDLRNVANRLGMYDAADYLRQRLASMSAAGVKAEKSIYMPRRPPPSKPAKALRSSASSPYDASGRSSSNRLPQPSRKWRVLVLDPLSDLSKNEWVCIHRSATYEDAQAWIEKENRAGHDVSDWVIRRAK